MREGGAGPHLGRDPNRFHEFLAAGTGAECRLGVTLDAVGARVTCATATAISCFTLAGRAPSSNTRSLKVRKEHPYRLS